MIFRVLALMQALMVDWSDPEGMKEKGFFLIPKSEKMIRTTINLSKHFFVAREKQRVVGFLMAYSCDVFAQLAQGEEDLPINEYVLKHPARPLIYISHIGIDPAKHGSGTAQKLLDALFLQEPQGYFIAYILHEPIRNERSIRLLSERNHFLLTNELTFDDKLCGAYEYGVPVKKHEKL